MRIKRFGIGWFFVSVSLLMPVSLAAQSIEQGTVEVAASVGVTSGIESADRITDVTGLLSDLSSVSAGPVTFDPGSQTKWNVGVSVGYAFMPQILAIGEIVRTRLDNPSVNLRIGPLGTSVGFNSSLLEVTGGVQANLPIGGSRVVPFVGAGLGVARSNVNVEESTFNVLDLDVSDTHFEVTLGGGARVFLSSRAGLRPEFKVVHISNETFFRTSIGVFFQF